MTQRDSNPWPLRCRRSSALTNWFQTPHFISHFFHTTLLSRENMSPTNWPLLNCDFIAQLVRALLRHRRGHGFESRWVTWIFQRALKELTTSGPTFCPIKLKEYSYPVVGSSFSGTSFLMNYYEDPKIQSVVSKLIYVSSKDRATKLTHRLQWRLHCYWLNGIYVRNQGKGKNIFKFCSSTTTVIHNNMHRWL